MWYYRKDLGWKVAFTARSRYSIDLDIHFIDHFQLRPSRIYASKLSQDELGYLANTYNFDLPDDYKFSELITNPFYLSEYLKFYTEGSHVGYLKFKELLWNKIIKKFIFFYPFLPDKASTFLYAHSPLTLTSR